MVDRLASTRWLKPVLEYPSSGYLRFVARPDKRVQIDLPATWDYLSLVMPWLRPMERGGPLLSAPELIAKGLFLLEPLTESAAQLLSGCGETNSRSELCIFVSTETWRSANELRERFTAEALFAKRDEWTVRRVLLTALAAECSYLLGNWPIEIGTGDYSPEPQRSEASH